MPLTDCRVGQSSVKLWRHLRETLILFFWFFFQEAAGPLAVVRPRAQRPAGLEVSTRDTAQRLGALGQRLRLLKSPDSFCRTGSEPTSLPLCLSFPLRMEPATLGLASHLRFPLKCSALS